MKMMFCVLGEGRGHMTQAMAVKEIVEAAGHQVVAVTLGASAQPADAGILRIGDEDARPAIADAGIQI